MFARLWTFATTAVIATIMSVGSVSALTITVDGVGSRSGIPLQVVFDISDGVYDSSDNTWSYIVSITNVDLGQEGSNALTGFALASDPAATYVEHMEVGDNPGSFYEPTRFQMNAGVSGSYDFCLSSRDGRNCNGGSVGAGLGEGQTYVMQLIVSASSEPNWFAAAGRWQGVGLNDYDSGTGEGRHVIPLPAAGWMLLGAIGGLAALRRRKSAA